MVDLRGGGKNGTSGNLDPTFLFNFHAHFCSMAYLAPFWRNAHLMQTDSVLVAIGGR